MAPFHGIMSSVRPAYYCYGRLGGKIEFATWLGQNSKQQKYQRLLIEVAKHLYLKTHAEKTDLCLDYISPMAAVILSKLQVGEVEDAIAFLDTYFLTREDVDTIFEMSLGADVGQYAKLPTTIKSAFTRRYNQASHKLPYAYGNA